METKKYVSLVKLKMVKEKKVTYTFEKLNEAQKVAELSSRLLKGVDREHLLVISVDAKYSPLALEVVSIGTVNAAMAEAREIFKHAILNGVAGIFIVHNHPSGDCTPSKEDERVTRRLQEAGDLLGIEVFDHVIIGDEDQYFSFVESRKRHCKNHGCIYTIKE